MVHLISFSSDNLSYGFFYHRPNFYCRQINLGQPSWYRIRSTPSNSTRSQMWPTKCRLQAWHSRPHGPDDGEYTKQWQISRAQNLHRQGFLEGWSVTCANQQLSYAVSRLQGIYHPNHAAWAARIKPGRIFTKRYQYPWSFAFFLTVRNRAKVMVLPQPDARPRHSSSVFRPRFWLLPRRLQNRRFTETPSKEGLVYRF